MKWSILYSKGKNDDRIRGMENTVSTVHPLDDQKANVIGRNLSPKIGIKLVQEKNSHMLLDKQTGEKCNFGPFGGNASVSDGILRPYRYAGRIPGTNRSDIK